MAILPSLQLSWEKPAPQPCPQSFPSWLGKYNGWGSRDCKTSWTVSALGITCRPSQCASKSSSIGYETQGGDQTTVRVSWQRPRPILWRSGMKEPTKRLLERKSSHKRLQHHQGSCFGNLPWRGCVLSEWSLLPTRSTNGVRMCPKRHEKISRRDAFSCCGSCSPRKLLCFTWQNAELWQCCSASPLWTTSLSHTGTLSPNCARYGSCIITWICSNAWGPRRISNVCTSAIRSAWRDPCGDSTDIMAPSCRWSQHSAWTSPSMTPGSGLGSWVRWQL
mmetsp:Transcript_16819/g.36176  ORF Transcript_16819/g.36176 Transcript_16819/m.36176 type:complete len:277 (-) Transcript_16819:1025-1855(-)